MLLELLKTPDPLGEPRELYRGNDRRWYVTYYGIVPQGDATRLIANGQLNPTYVGNFDVLWLEPYSIDLRASRAAWAEDSQAQIMVVRDCHTNEIKTIPWQRRVPRIVRPRAGPRSSKLTARRALALELHDKHKSLRTVATLMGCTHQNVARLLRDAKEQP